MSLYINQTDINKIKTFNCICTYIARILLNESPFDLKSFFYYLCPFCLKAAMFNIISHSTNNKRHLSSGGGTTNLGPRHVRLGTRLQTSSHQLARTPHAHGTSLAWIHLRIWKISSMRINIPYLRVLQNYCFEKNSLGHNYTNWLSEMSFGSLMIAPNKTMWNYYRQNGPYCPI